MGRVATGFNWADQMDGLFGKGGLMEKASFQTGQQGRSNAVFGEVLWQQVNVQTPVFGLLPKIPADTAPGNINNPRPRTYRTSFQPPTMDSLPEGGQWGDPQTWETREVQIQPKHSTIRFENTLLQELYADIQDDVPFENLTQIGEEYFQRSFEREGLTRAVISSNQSGEQYSNDDAFTMLDRVIASADEEANATDPNGDAFADGDLDYGDIDRSDTGGGGDNEANWADSVVDHNGGTPRQLTRDVVNDTIDTLEDNGTRRENLIIVTGRDTARVLSDLRDSQFRGDFHQNADRQMGDRGQDDGETRWGVPTNTQISHWDGVPLVPAPDIPSDTLSRIFILDLTTMTDEVTGETMPKLGVETYIPMFTEIAGLGEQTNTLALGELKNQVGMGVTHEVRCQRFNHQAKIRDLEE
jgi:hypothetical protein